MLEDAHWADQSTRDMLSFLFGLTLLAGAEAAYRFEQRVRDPRVRQALAGAGLATLFPITLSAAARAPGMAPGAGIAAMSSTGYFGFLIGPPLIGFVAELTGLRGALVLIVAAGVVITLLAGNAAHPGKKAG